MSIRDVLKKSFLTQFDTDISTMSLMTALFFAAVIGTYIFIVYRMVCRKSFYSKSFAISMPVISMITTSIIITIQSNAVISLGMVGALSIVRFRTAIKDPMDLAFLFWSISVGIICGAGLAQVAVILSVVITVGILVLDQLPVAKAPMILVVNANDLDAEEAILAAAKQYVKHLQVKSRNMTDVSLDLVIELRTGEGSALVRDVKKVSGVTAVSLLAHDGEVTF
jgi:uncharacterized membrane protein YhiD involved in acid resistance